MDCFVMPERVASSVTRTGTPAGARVAAGHVEAPPQPSSRPSRAPGRTASARAPARTIRRRRCLRRRRRAVPRAGVVDAHLAAEQQSDLDAAIAGYTEDVEHDVVGAPGGPLRGPAAARQRYVQLLEHLRTDRLTELRRFYGDNMCVVEHECSATVFGDFAGLPGRGRSARFRMLHVFEFREGLISRET